MVARLCRRHCFLLRSPGAGAATLSRRALDRPSAPLTCLRPARVTTSQPVMGNDDGTDNKVDLTVFDNDGRYQRWVDNDANRALCASPRAE